MAERKEYLAFNRGLVSRLALGRIDIKRVAMSAQLQTNFVPRVLGPMSLRAGWKYLGATFTNLKTRNIPFIFSTTDTALVELTEDTMRVRVADVLISRPVVSTAITNGDFTSDLTGWTNADEGASSSSWASGLMVLEGTGSSAAVRYQTITIGGSDQNVQHAIIIRVVKGDCILRVGSTVGGDDYITETTLRAGDHSLAFTPTGAAVTIQLMSRLSYPTTVEYCKMSSSGVMEVPAPWTEENLPYLRYKQSGDVIFVACRGVKPKRIERRGTNSWSVVDYVANKGPLRNPNTSPITIDVSALTGEVTLTASEALFKETNVGGLFAIDSTGQAVTSTISSADTFSAPIRVTGIGSGRTFGITVSGTFTATVTLQRSVGSIGTWVDVANYTGPVSTTLSDTLDNQIIYYRIGIKPANYTSGTVVVTLSYAAGTIRGYARVTSYVSPTEVLADAVSDFGALTATVNWYEGAWSPRRGYPSAIGLHDGRVWWAGKDKINGSVSDDFANFDSDTEGDSAPINRSIGAGPVDNINWFMESQQLLMGTEGAELVCRSSSLDEPLTPTNFNLKPATNRGSRGVDAVQVDTSVMFVDRSGSRVYELEYDKIGAAYSGIDLTAIAPEVGLPEIVQATLQRRPDTRLHFVLTDGTVALLVYDKTEDVKAWIKIETDGIIEDVSVLPADEEDAVYYTVARTIGGVTKRYVERWALQSDCVGGTLNKQADSFVEYSGAATATISGLDHLEGETVVCWADGVDKGTFEVSGGSITLPSTVTNAIVGLWYRARYRSVKIGTLTDVRNTGSLTSRKKIEKIGLVLLDTHAKGLKFGQSFDYLDDMPDVELGGVIDADYIWEEYDFDNTTLNGTYSSDARLCLEANAPRPCTVMAVVIDEQNNGK